MVPVACTAIVNVLDARGDELIDLPSGVSFRGEASVDGHTIVENLHLWAFVYANLEGEDE
jgi:hypothetical protein